MATSLFIGTLLFSPSIQSPTLTAHSIEFSSALPPQNSCLHFYLNNKKYFNTVLFQVYKAKLLKQESVVDKDIKNSIRSPEEFLAIIEVLSERENYEGFRFEDRLDQLSPRELKKLQSVINSYTKDGTLSQIKFSNLIVAIYRFFNRPPSRWRTLYETRSLKETWERIDDALIRERLQTSLFNENMETTFKTIVSDPTLTQKFVQALKDNAPWIDTALFAGLWGSAIWAQYAVGFDLRLSPTTILSLMPPYVPGLGQVIKISLDKSDLSTARLYGFKKATEDAKERLKSMFKVVHTRDAMKWTYSAVFTSMFFITMGPTLYKMTTPGGRFMLAMEQMDADARRNNEMTVEQRGEEFYQDYLSQLDQMNIKYDKKSPEMKAKRLEYFEIAKAAAAEIEAVKKQTPTK